MPDYDREYLDDMLAESQRICPVCETRNSIDDDPYCWDCGYKFEV